MKISEHFFLIGMIQVLRYNNENEFVNISDYISKKAEYKLMKKIEPDKWRHFFAGIIMGAILQVITIFMFPSLFIATMFTLLVVVVISYGFELFSLVTGLGYYDFLDAVATVIGGLLGMGFILLFQL